jgi:hypothetical protein
MENRGKPITCKYCDHKFKVNTKNKRKKWKESKYQCPKCDITYCILKPTERQLRMIQDKYDVSKKEKYINEMYPILISYAESLIKKYYINRIKFTSQLTYYAENAVSLFLEEYCKDVNFSIDISFGEFLRLKCAQAIFGKPEHDTPGESLDFTHQDGHAATYEDTRKTMLDSVQDHEEKYLLCKNLCHLIFELEEECYSKEENYIRLLNVDSYLDKGENVVDDFFRLYGRNGKYITKQTINFLRTKLIEIIGKSKAYSFKVAETLSKEKIMSSEFKINKKGNWKKVLLSSSDKEGDQYFFDGKWRPIEYFSKLERREKV